jgi:hypothetical protein
MNRIAVQSSNVTSVGYDASSSTLEVAFHSGGVYQYFGVPSITTSLLQVAWAQSVNI